MAHLADKLVTYFSQRKQQPFNQQKGGQQKRNINTFWKVLNALSGDDIDFFLLHVFTKTNKGKVCFDAINKNTFIDENIIQGVHIHNNTAKSHKAQVLSIFSTTFSRASLKRKGFTFSNDQFTSSKKLCLNFNERANLKRKDNSAGLMSSKKLCIRHSDHKRKNLTAGLMPSSKRLRSDCSSPRRVYIYKEIEKFLQQNSNISSDCTKLYRPLDCIKKILTPVYYLSENKHTLYYKFKQAFPKIKLSKSSFYNYIPNYFKYSSKKTDQCDICEQGKKNLQKLFKLQTEIHKDCNEKTRYLCISDLCSGFQKIESVVLEKYENIQKNIQIYNSHKKHTQQQRKKYNNIVENLAEDSCVLVIDFKENLRLGGGPVETNKLFYSKSLCSVLGFVLIKKEKNKIEHSYYDFFSTNLSHDSLFVKQCFDLFLQQEEMKKFKDINIWTDCGPHFLSKEFAQYALNDIPLKYQKNIEWNLFGEYHGKSVVDGHFGLLSRFFSEIEKQKNINCIDELIVELRKKIDFIKENQTTNPLKILFFQYQQTDRPENLSFLNISSMKKYSCFKRINDKLYGFIDVDDFEGTEISSKIYYRKDTRTTRKAIDLKKQNEVENIKVNQKYVNRSHVLEQVSGIYSLIDCFSRIML